ncbi:Phosphate transporter PHO1 [Glycine soja]|uniref:Phosphate transporter PHO1 n=1 Tax=Glycine soja TaxID=3848 RepID=A0A445LQY2_GLYSO|nr:Phosphate transporter PHO1 [Glycine soja]
MVAAEARVTYSRQNDNLWFAIILITYVVATMYQLYWDFIKDWGFLNPKSINPWLRNDLILKNKNIYYMSIVLNIVLRVTWVETIMHFKVGPVHSQLLDFLLVALEVIRRGHWNFYKVLDRRLQEAWARATKEDPRVLMNLRVDLMEACLWGFYGGWIFELQWGPLMVIFHHGDAAEDKGEEVRGGAIH